MILFLYFISGHKTRSWWTSFTVHLCVLVLSSYTWQGYSTVIWSEFEENWCICFSMCLLHLLVLFVVSWAVHTINLHMSLHCTWQILRYSSLFKTDFYAYVSVLVVGPGNWDSPLSNEGHRYNVDGYQASVYIELVISCKKQFMAV
jgi:hypothetical protein